MWTLYADIISQGWYNTYFTMLSFRVTTPLPIATNKYQVYLYIKYKTYEMSLSS